MEQRRALEAIIVVCCTLTAVSTNQHTHSTCSHFRDRWKIHLERNLSPFGHIHLSLRPFQISYCPSPDDTYKNPANNNYVASCQPLFYGRIADRKLNKSMGKNIINGSGLVIGQVASLLPKCLAADLSRVRSS